MGVRGSCHSHRRIPPGIFGAVSIATHPRAAADRPRSAVRVRVAQVVANQRRHLRRVDPVLLRRVLHERPERLQDRLAPSPPSRTTPAAGGPGPDRTTGRARALQRRQRLAARRRRLIGHPPSGRRTNTAPGHSRRPARGRLPRPQRPRHRHLAGCNLAEGLPVPADAVRVLQPIGHPLRRRLHRLGARPRDGQPTDQVEQQANGTK